MLYPIELRARIGAGLAGFVGAPWMGAPRIAAKGLDRRLVAGAEPSGPDPLLQGVRRVGVPTPPPTVDPPANP